MVLELSMELNNDDFYALLKHVVRNKQYLRRTEDGYVDSRLSDKGMMVSYRDSQYKKKIKLLIDLETVLCSSAYDSDKFKRKLNKRISEYFDFQYSLNDFSVSGAVLTTDINVGSRKNVTAYMKIFQRIGKVKGYSQYEDERLEGVDSFCLEGNSNGIDFLIYALDGMLRAEVRLVKSKAIHHFTNAEDVQDVIVELLDKRNDIFMDVFSNVIPFGDFYKKGKAVELIWNNVEDIRLRRKMLRLVELIPEKKSLYLAQKTMKCRNMKKVMGEFAKINLSPVTISKRQDKKKLDNVYTYFVADGHAL
jgi:hypothetical protein